MNLLVIVDLLIAHVFTEGIYSIRTITRKKRTGATHVHDCKVFF